ncbi:OmcA/MtrC family decaheme c-type cytochrome [Shewanella submarina]|uniref:OmcA/MtrC family decaheme c-type cytochrome n=1 Tax=Shewanella submarina TaxID=2016376 RepID=A0ABV7GDB8_9GAMM|nr:OmcA/MtrC family decaheme c-type cytochrome [Shewanella submarina]MCL1036605.1 OmcA/MtrC family decaheme c-type cytochrome [Shewanella submarina]
MRWSKRNLWVVMAGALALAACDGEDGKDGEDGSPGIPGGPGDPGAVGLHIDMANEANANITSAVINDGVITLEFELTNNQGVGLFGLDGDNPFHDFRFSIAQMAVDGKLKQWQSLLNDATNDDATTFEQGFEKIKDCPDCLTDNKDGSYSYTFQTNLNTYVDAAGISFDPALTQRIAIEMQFEYDSGHELAENAHYDWIPASGSQDGIETRQLVTMETCYTCHQPDSLKAHGGRRLDMENCQSCHNGIVSDPNGVSVELGHMVHAIHMGPNREGKDANGDIVPMPYTVQGYGGAHAFDYPMFPTKPFMDCQTCHVEDEQLADMALWKENANANACTGCHTDSPAQHGNVTIPEEMTCIQCHGGTDHTKMNAPYDAAKGFDVSVTQVTVTPANLLQFDVTIMDAQGNAVPKEQVYQKGYSNPYMVVSWDVEKDYPESTGSGETLGTTYDHRRFSLIGDGSTQYNEQTRVFTVTTEKMKGDKTYTLALPADIAERSLEILPVLKVCFAGKTDQLTDCSAEDAYPAYVQTDAYRAFLGDPDKQVAQRRSIVDNARCHDCHSAEFYHDSNGVNCISCHVNDKNLKSAGTDDKGKEMFKPTNFMYKAHKAEGHHNGHGGSGTVLKTDCTTCHSAEEGWGGMNYGFELGRNGGAALAFPEDIYTNNTWFASADVGSCLSCHQKYMSEAGFAHMRNNGGYFGPEKTEAQNAKEACATCHSPQKLMQHHGHSLD